MGAGGLQGSLAPGKRGPQHSWLCTCEAFDLLCSQHTPELLQQQGCR